MERSTVHTLLHDLAESPAPPSTLDIRRATATGRRTIRIRRMLTAGTAAVAVAALTGVLGVVVAGGNNAAPRPAPLGTASQTPPPPDRPMPEQAPAAFDPMVQYAQPDWLPDGSLGTSTRVAREWLSVTENYQGLPTGPGNDSSYGSVALFVAISGRGVDPALFDGHAVAPGDMPAGTTADPVNGRRAEWMPGESTGLRWEYAPGAWAAVVVHNMPGVNPAEIARRVATEVRFGVDLHVRLPYTAVIPASLPASTVQVSQQHDGGWSIQVDYGTERTRYGDWPLSILAFPSTAETGDGAVIGDPNTTVDGHKARTTTLLDGGSALQVFNVDGVYVEMLTHSQQTTSLLPGGSLVDLFRSMKLYRDPAQWG